MAYFQQVEIDELDTWAKTIDFDNTPPFEIGDNTPGKPEETPIWRQKMDQRHAWDISRANFPDQLKDDRIKLCKVHRNEKVPVGEGWQSKPFTHEDEELISSIKTNGLNYGVMCGYGNLIVIDWDDREIYEKHGRELPETFQTKSPSSKNCPHSYYFVTDEQQPKGFRVDNSDGNRIADVQGFGTQVLGPGSIHDYHIEGPPYKVVNDVPIAETTLAHISDVFKQYKIICKSEPKSYKRRGGNGEVEEIKRMIPVSKILSEMGINTSKSPTDCPFHTSKNKQCLSFDDSKGIWHCFHCDRSGDIFNLVETGRGIGFKDALALLKTEAGLDNKPQTVSLETSASVIQERTTEIEYPDPVEAGIVYFEDDETQTGARLDNFNMAETMADLFHIKNLAGILHTYKDGVYRAVDHKKQILHYCKKLLKEDKYRRLLNTRQNTEVMSHIETDTFVSRDIIADNSKYLAFNNCLLNLETYETEPFSPDIFILNKLGFDFDPDAACPNWLRYLQTTFNDDESRRFLQQITGYIFYREMPIESMFFFTGPPGTGKSVYHKVLSKMLGLKNCCTVKLHDFADAQQRAKFYGRMLNVSAESKFINQKVFVSSSVLEATSGDLMDGKILYKDRFEFRPYTKHIVNFNDLPKWNDPELPFFDRLQVLAFTNRFRNTRRQIPNYDDILIREAAGIVNWALRGLKQLQAKDFKGFDVPKASIELKEEYKREVDPVYHFAQKCLVPQAGTHIALRELYDVCFTEFCQDIGEKAGDFLVPKRSFNKSLKAMDYEIRDHSVGEVLKNHTYKPLISD
jgi:P4 family phage/plasmid primase-like protien